MFLTLNHYLRYEQDAIDKCLRHHHGYELMWIGVGEHSGAKASPVCHHFKAGFNHAEPSTVLIEDNMLPFANDSIDVIVLNHYLEQQKSFDAFINEAHRVLRHDGMLLITGFSPCRHRSYHLFKRLMPQKIKAYFRSVSRLRKLVEPVGFSLYRHYYYGFSNSLKIEGLLKKCVPGLSVGYVLLLQKRTVKLTPLKMGWTTEKFSEVKEAVKPVVKPVAKPVTRDQT